ncbi:MAG: hypothetical protein QOH81_1129 [Sphingomonadales bacterium]|jgi:hypothetical protein|nr:hypothetical protein [Sphingomonadales bacterium]
MDEQRDAPVPDRSVLASCSFFVPSSPDRIESLGLVMEYRVTVFGMARGPWRRDRRQALRDAIELDLGCYDEWGRFFLTVPAEIEARRSAAAAA